jgi:hypothetical protein
MSCDRSNAATGEQSTSSASPLSASRRLLAEFRRQLGQRACDLDRGPVCFLRHRDPVFAAVLLAARQLRHRGDRHPGCDRREVCSGLERIGIDPEQDGLVLLYLLGVKDANTAPVLANPETVKAKTFASSTYFVDPVVVKSLQRPPDIGV